MTKGNRIWSILSGIISLILGTLVITNPIPSLLTLVMILGAFMITSGIFIIIDAININFAEIHVFTILVWPHDSIHNAVLPDKEGNKSNNRLIQNSSSLLISFRELSVKIISQVQRK